MKLKEYVSSLFNYECSGSLVLTMVYFSLYLNLITEFIRILDCYIAIVFPFSHQQYVTQVRRGKETEWNQKILVKLVFITIFGMESGNFIMMSMSCLLTLTTTQK